jgi:hypothetical protein
VKWIKRGVLFEPAGQASWIGTHAALPFVDEGAEGLRVFFSSRDARGRSHIGFVRLDLDDPERSGVGAAPALAPGSLGAFDDAGVTNSCLIRDRGKYYLYYTGWSLGVSVPFYLAAGVAVSDDGVTFHRVSRAPLLERNELDPFLTASPWVLVDGNVWRMWYVSGTSWDVVNAQPRHRYLIKYAESLDGCRWSRSGVVCIGYQDDREYAFGRPCVRRDGDIYKMWYSCRGERYQLGYAESPDGISWVRKDGEAGLLPSDEGWDSEMITYPAVFHHRGRLHMLYNGNDYGRTGIGLAIAE